MLLSTMMNCLLFSLVVSAMFISPASASATYKVEAEASEAVLSIYDHIIHRKLGFDFYSAKQVFNSRVKMSNDLQVAIQRSMEPPVSVKHRIHSPRGLSNISFCSWNGQVCGPNQDYIRADMINSPVLSGLGSKIELCSMKTSDAECQAVAGCVWDKLSCVYSASQHAQQALMSSVVPAHRCGWLAEYMSAGAECAGHTSSSSSITDSKSCAADTTCKVSTHFDISVGGPNCVASPTCSPADDAMMAAMCPNSGFQDLATLAKSCAKSVAPPSSENPQERINQLVACLSEKCTLIATMLITTIPIQMGCQKLTSKAECTAKAKCSFEDSKCSANMNGVMHAMVPEGCAYGAMFTEMAKCSGKTQSSCTDAACEWATTKTCNSSGAPLTESKCNLKPSVVFRTIATSTYEVDTNAAMRIVSSSSECVRHRAEGDCLGAHEPDFPAEKWSLTPAEAPLRRRLLLNGATHGSPGATVLI